MGRTDERTRLELDSIAVAILLEVNYNLVFSWFLCLFRRLSIENNAGARGRVRAH